MKWYWFWIMKYITYHPLTGRASAYWYMEAAKDEFNIIRLLWYSYTLEISNPSGYIRAHIFCIYSTIIVWLLGFMALAKDPRIMGTKI